MAASISIPNQDLVRLYQLINEEEEEKCEEFQKILEQNSVWAIAERSLLCSAAQQGRRGYVKTLLDQRADPLAKSDCSTAIDRASCCARQHRIAEYVEIFKAFVKKRVNFFDYEFNRDESYTFGGTLVERVLFTNEWSEKADPGFFHHYKLIEVLVSNGAFSNTAFVRIKDRFEDFTPEQIETIRNTIRAAKEVFERRTGKREPSPLRGADGYDRRWLSDSDSEETKEGTTPRDTELEKDENLSV